ncbi:MAG TPA: hypothetical protein VN885_08760 [Candidatus Acidoferrales bacterium]|nr:hypothetical protein [Candidatus Acidoferrales bacterium]
MIAISLIQYPDETPMLGKFPEDIVLRNAAVVTAHYAHLLADAKIFGVVPFGVDARGGLWGYDCLRVNAVLNPFRAI